VLIKLRGKVRLKFSAKVIIVGEIFRALILFLLNGVHLNGTVNWLTRKSIEQFSIVSLDLSTEHTSSFCYLRILMGCHLFGSQILGF